MNCWKSEVGRLVYSTFVFCFLILILTTSCFFCAGFILFYSMTYSAPAHNQKRFSLFLLSLLYLFLNVDVLRLITSPYYCHYGSMSLRHFVASSPILLFIHSPLLYPEAGRLTPVARRLHLSTFIKDL
jgi:hypothetical protein